MRRRENREKSTGLRVRYNRPYLPPPQSLDIYHEPQQFSRISFKDRKLRVKVGITLDEADVGMDYTRTLTVVEFKY